MRTIHVGLLIALTIICAPFAQSAESTATPADQGVIAQELKTLANNTKDFQFKTMAQRKKFQELINNIAFRQAVTETALVNQIQALETELAHARNDLAACSNDLRGYAAARAETERRANAKPKVSVALYTNAPLKAYSIFAEDQYLDKIGVPRERFIEAEGYLINEGDASANVTINFEADCVDHYGNKNNPGEEGPYRWSIQVGYVPARGSVPFRTRFPLPTRYLGTGSLRYWLN